MRRLTTMVTVLLLMLVACGGETGGADADGAGDQTETTRTDTSSPDDDDGGSDDTSPPAGDGANDDDGGDSEGEGPSTATVTLGDDTYEFSSDAGVVAQCLTDLFGIFSIQLVMIDETGATAEGNVAIIVLHEDTDPDVVGEVNSVRLDIGDEIWVADEADEVITQAEQFEAGMSQVDSVEIDGRTVSGTATFVRQGSLFAGGEVETMTGTFEATCGEERTS